MDWKQAHFCILNLTFLGVILVLLKSIFAPGKFQITAKTYSFPESVILPEWQFQSSYPLSNLRGRIYQYKRDKINLQIEMQYEFGANEELFRQYNPKINSANKTAAIIREKNKIGAYSLSIEKNRAYLRSCINPYAPAVITKEQFVYNRYTFDLRLDRLLPVFLQQEPVLNRQCFWAHLSVPVQNSSSENAYQVLENAWISWYPYWHSRFP
ncbi:cyanoexosortase A system-associated protein [Tolypothrix sp. FACHB-123]|uniref:cyanoexosortase A system-associated protein n=1 Tax=Tolypothrix sp. FACHB-123 TaxID=2692868 RepID=UPI001688CE50|nr:cyanoexosortase A system-associated protein [Tolypothrix sp. FACHB-123]MBD2358423.1 cyanoexosortase A system-associated protein [Tolypothrix sp. FACHB-123]